MDPEELLERFRRRGEPEAFGALFDATAPELHRVALALTKDPATADDVVQEAYLAALRLLPRFERGKPVMPWLVALLQRRLQHARRSERRARARALVGARGEAVPADGSTSHAERAALHAALEGLEEPYRGVALLRWRYGLEPADIARVRGEPAGTTRSLLSRAAERLRSRFPGGLPAAFPAIPGGLDAVRARVLERVRPRGNVPPAAAPPAGGIAKGLAVACVALLALGGGGVVLAVAGRAGPLPVADPPPRASAAVYDAAPGLAVARAAEFAPAAVASGEAPPPAAPPPPGNPFAFLFTSPVDDPALPAERSPLRITVVDRWGSPVPEAAVHARWGEWRTGFVRTDADGRAELRVPKGTRCLEVMGAGAREERRFLFVHYHPLVGEPAEARVVLRIATEIVGRLVTRAGVPIAGARVRAAPSAYGCGPADTDADGRFRLGAVEGDVVDVRFDGELADAKDGKPQPTVDPELRGIVRGVVAGRGGEVVIVAEPASWGHEVLVRVRDEEGHPVAGASVLAEVAGAVAANHVGRTDAEGCAVLRGLPRWPCVVRVQGFAVGSERRLMDRSVVDVVPGGAPVDIVLVASATLKGRVLDQEWKPVAGAWCAALESAGYVACFRTDEDGRFEAPSNVAAGTRLQVTGRFPMEDATSCGVVDGVVAGGADLTIVLRRFREPGAPPAEGASVRVGGSVRIVSR